MYVYVYVMQEKQARAQGESKLEAAHASMVSYVVSYVILVWYRMLSILIWYRGWSVSNDARHS